MSFGLLQLLTIVQRQGGILVIFLCCINVDAG
jgi:hypothetical protein